MKAQATFFITTARSGTQWLVKALQAVYGDLARVEHEPIYYDYRPRLYLRAYDSVGELQSIPRVSSHLADIQAELENRDYIEVGFPCFAAAPLFHKVLPGQIRLVQLLRHPVYTAASLVTHDWYRGTRTENLEPYINLQPGDAGVFQRHYADRWAGMSTYERCLFYWTEVHQFAAEIQQRYPDVPFHTVRFEDLIGEPERYLRELVDFLGLPYRNELLEWVGVNVDTFQHKTRQLIRWRQIHDHPLTMDFARQFNYDLETIDYWRFLRRYWIFLDRRWPSMVVKRIFRRVMAAGKSRH